MRYDAVVVGAGHNGLTAAAYLAKAGLKVAVFEKRGIVGGCAVTEEPYPGFKFSSLSYVNSLFRPEIVKELNLQRYGYEMLPRNPSSFSPFPNKKYLLLGPDKDMVRREIGKFSQKDADRYFEYEAMLEKMAALLEPLLARTPPNPGKLRFGELVDFGGLLWRQRADMKEHWPELMRFLTGSATDMLNDWFESEELKVTLATDAVIGANAGPSTPGTAYILFHHVMGECNGVRGVWGYMRGGMGGLTQALARACVELGVTIHTGQGVEKILCEAHGVSGVVAGGKEYGASVVVSNATPQITFMNLVGAGQLPAEFVRDVKRINYDSATVKINLALKELPDFLACPGKVVGPQHKGTIHIAPSMQYLEEAYADSVAGRPSAHPILECTIPSAIDDTLAPPGQHVMNMFVQYGPYQLRNGKTWDECKESFADRCIDVLAEYAPNIRDAILYRQVLTPLDMEREYSLTGGSISHGRMTMDQMFHMRPIPGYADYRTPVKGLYLCGAGMHPGGGVMGTPALNAVREILRDQ